MEISNEIQQELFPLMKKKWELSEDILNINQLKAQLQAAIAKMLREDMEALMQLAYRLDLNEEAVAMAFRQQEVPEIAAAFTDLIIQREIQKIYTRHLFKS